MITISAVWVVVALLCLAAAVWFSYRLGVLSTRPQVAQLEGQCEALKSQIDAHADIDKTLTPLQHAMTNLSKQVESAERARVSALSGLSEQVLTVGREVGSATQDVKNQAQRITQALSRTQHQGAWGEMQLRRLVEASGMLNHVHFTEQSSMSDDDRRLRPDMIVELGQGRQVVVDAKVSLDAFLNPDLEEQAQASLHAAAVADQVARLAGKQYWKAAGSPEFVILFLPAEHMLGVALRARPDLLQTAFDRKVVLATPTTLMATLRSISWAWQQAAMADQAQDVLEAGRQLHDRLTVLHSHLARVGKGLSDAVGGYNQFLGSLESRVLPSARRLAGIVATEQAPVQMPQVDIRPRATGGHDESPDESAMLEDTG